MYPYKQILCDMESGIFMGKWKPGSRIPSVRELAVQYWTNPNTVQRAVRELEREGLILSRRGCGMSVTEDVDMIRRLRQERTKQVFGAFASRMKEMGYSPEQVKDMLDKNMPEDILPPGTGPAENDRGGNDEGINDEDDRGSKEEGKGGRSGKDGNRDDRGGRNSEGADGSVGNGNSKGGSGNAGSVKMLELHILSILGARELYGYQILQELTGDRKVSKPSLYAALRRMDAERLLTVRAEVCNGRLRKYYQLTESGTACLEYRLQQT